MIVLGADTHKRSHTIAAVAAATGELLGEQTVQVGSRGFDALLRWGRGLDDELVWALEDCRHVSGSLERFLIERGERVLRIPTHLTAKERKRARQRGKSDAIDALHVARAVLQEGLDSFPAAHLDGPELDLRLLVDHRERLVRHRVELNSTLLWHLHDLWPELQLPGGALFSKKWSTRIGGPLARAEQTMRVRIARDMLRRLRELTQTVNQLEREITALVEQVAPQLLTEPGFGPLIAAKLVGEIAGARRDIDITDLLERVTTPTLVLHARDEVSVPFDQGRPLATRIPGARFVPLQSRNHILLADEPAWEIFLAELHDFIGTGEPPVSVDLADLSKRELQLLELVAAGLSNEEIAERLYLSVRTVERHLSNIYVKLRVSGKAARAAAAARYSESR